jgi:cardiolipin synthase A/B
VLRRNRAIPFRLRQVAAAAQAGAAAGAIRIGNAVGAVFTNRRVLQPVEGRLIFAVGSLLLGWAALLYFFPGVTAYPLMVVFGWIGFALIYRAFKLRRCKTQAESRGHRSQ